MSRSVTVAICTWNRAGMLEQSLRSFLDLRVPEGVSWELLVVNNNCTDNTDQVVRGYQGRLPVVLCHEPRAGKVYALNHAIARASGDFILWTDDDVQVDPQWVSATLNVFDEHRADMVFGKVVPWWETSPPEWFSELFHSYFALLDYGDETRPVTDRHAVPYGVNYAFRREVFERLGGFLEGLGPLGRHGGGGEDEEIFWRLLDAGMQVVYTPDAPIRHFIPKERCTKRFYRGRAWGAGADHYRLLCHKDSHVPWLFGLPRYFLRQQARFAVGYCRALVRGERSRLFYNELKLIRLAGLFREAIKARWRRLKARRTKRTSAEASAERTDVTGSPDRTTTGGKPGVGRVLAHAVGAK